MTRWLLIPRRGQNTVEFALFGSLLLLLTMGLLDLAMAVWEYNTLSHLAREGARYGVVPRRTPAQIQAYVVTRAVLPGLSTSNVTVTQRGNCGQLDSADDPVVVTVDYQYHPATGLISAATGSTVNLQARASMYVEQGLTGVDCACGGPCT